MRPREESAFEAILGFVCIVALAALSFFMTYPFAD